MQTCIVLSFLFEDIWLASYNKTKTLLFILGLILIQLYVRSTLVVSGRYIVPTTMHAWVRIGMEQKEGSIISALG
ncbi:uncharacterized protein BT62DRAFT_705156 [Guyanagaster necrorhizus]|uniref:Uncharacterized protein n=1 Tax=Guyanagaster necrorhizus TaxID=856835 RepID=A0A9P8AUE8_9AGAR|nr:uncharacterized protein BT62DRAFT_705156 [Guyanagaster necrorhizus MCA 3950]KAG7448414.1 hypothetical protein BT62DRAFT_705156 [Guyanagaster necrorhizus MCA 3950]